MSIRIFFYFFTLFWFLEVEQQYSEPSLAKPRITSLVWSNSTTAAFLICVWFCYYVDNGDCEDDTETLSCPCIWCGRVWQSTKLLSGTMCVLRSWSRGKCLSKLSHFTLLNIILSPSGDLGVALIWDNHPSTPLAASWLDRWNPLPTELNYLWWVLSCFRDDIRSF